MLETRQTANLNPAWPGWVKVLNLKSFRLALGLLFLGALFALRLGPAGQERFAVDEAHHSGWALKIANGDPFMRTIAADKPPQLFYMIAASYKLFGESETAARLPAALLSALIILPLWGLGRRLYPAEPGIAALAVGLLALSPLAQVYGPTAFTDPLMAFWLVTAAWLVASQRFFWAGLALGLAICAKQQALFFLPFPVFLGLLIILRTEGGGRKAEEETASKEVAAFPKLETRSVGVPWKQNSHRKSVLGTTLKTFFLLRPPPAALILLAVLGAAIPIGVVLGFDKWRGQTSSLAYGAALNGDKLSLVSPGGLPTRLVDWWNRVVQYFFAPNPLGLLLLAGWLVFGGMTLWRLGRWWRNRRETYPLDRTVLCDTALYAAILIIIAWHTALSFPVWDRYLLPLVPFAALLIARMLTWIAGLVSGRWMSRRAGPALVALIVLGLMVIPVAQAAAYRLPLGGDYLAFRGSGPGQHGAYEGIERLAPFFKNNARPGAVVFAEEMDWEFSYYLFGLPLELPSNKSKPLDPAGVAAFAARGETFVVFTDWQQEAFRRLDQGLAPLGFKLEPAIEIFSSDDQRRSFVVYRPIPVGTH